MNRALFTAASGLAAQQQSLDVISNNLANANTVGFKSLRADFQDVMYQQQREPGASTGPNSTLPTGMQIGQGVSAATTVANFTTGTLQNTGGDFDIAIKGDGFFKVMKQDGTFGYTRAGNFAIDAQGKLVTSDGLAVQPEVTIPPNKTSVTISPDGTVQVGVPGQGQQKVGQIQLTNFPNPAGLKNVGGNLFEATSASGAASESAPNGQGSGSLIHKALESSNVDIVNEMVRMIILQRTYDTNSKVVQAADEMLSTTNNLKR